MSPMCQYCARRRRGRRQPTDWHLTHLGARAVGGAGLVMAEATAVTPGGPHQPADLGLWNDRQQEAFARITRFLSEHGAVPAVQLAHAGRKASTRRPWRGRRPQRSRARTAGVPVAPRPDPLRPDVAHPSPRSLDTGGIDRLVGRLRRRGRAGTGAGFRVVPRSTARTATDRRVPLPFSNHRHRRLRRLLRGPDAWFALRVVDAVRAVWPEELPRPLPRLGPPTGLAEDPADDREGWSVDDTVRFGQGLSHHGVDLLDVLLLAATSPGRASSPGPGYRCRSRPGSRPRPICRVGPSGRSPTPAGRGDRRLRPGRRRCCSAASCLRATPTGPKPSRPRAGPRPAPAGPPTSTTGGLTRPGVPRDPPMPRRGPGGRPLRSPASPPDTLASATDGIRGRGPGRGGPARRGRPPVTGGRSGPARQGRASGVRAGRPGSWVGLAQRHRVRQHPRRDHGRRSAGGASGPRRAPMPPGGNRAGSLGADPHGPAWARRAWPAGRCR
ncbi:hypothetical protein [Streptosporangium longisporum]|uniref:oxidoreductase n=1 Tax=Streptosporangium longisporum TaxID=46187 RepID=UPI0031E6002D